MGGHLCHPALICSRSLPDDDARWAALAAAVGPVADRARLFVDNFNYHQELLAAPFPCVTIPSASVLLVRSLRTLPPLPVQPGTSMDILTDHHALLLPPACFDIAGQLAAFFGL